MNTIKIKSEIHKLIDVIEDHDLLKQFYEVLHDRATAHNKDILDELNTSQKTRIKKSITQVERGQTIKNEEIKNDLKK